MHFNLSYELWSLELVNSKALGEVPCGGSWKKFDKLEWWPETVQSIRKSLECYEITGSTNKNLQKHCFPFSETSYLFFDNAKQILFFTWYSAKNSKLVSVFLKNKYTYKSLIYLFTWMAIWLYSSCVKHQ